VKEGWPRCEPITVTAGANVSAEDLAVLNQAGLPKRAFEIGRLSPELVGVDVPGYGYLIRLTEPDDDAFNGINYYYEPASGRVMMLSNRPGATPAVVNSSLEQFTRMVRATIDAFPFYEDLDEGLEARDWDDEERNAAEEKLIEDRAAAYTKMYECLHAIDPVALDQPGFWDEQFLYAFELGHLSTQEVMAYPWS
jgi:hypothetical protein